MVMARSCRPKLNFPVAVIDKIARINRRSADGDGRRSSRAYSSGSVVNSSG
jgi:hypothetical protein